MVRRLARTLLGAAFVSSGVEALRDVDNRADKARSLGVPEPVQASRAVAGTQIVAGALLSLNRFPRLATLALAATVLPEAATGHQFWSEKDKTAKATQRSLFTRDLGLLGGLLIATADTGGRESLPHRATRASRKASKVAAAQSKAAKKQAKDVRKQAKNARKNAKGAGKSAAKQAQRQVQRIG